MLRLYTIFNVDQVSGLDHLKAGQPDTDEGLTVDYQPADDAIAATGANIRFGGSKAFYSLSDDYIQMPPRPPSSHSTSSTARSSTSFVIGVSRPRWVGPETEGKQLRPWRTRR